MINKIAPVFIALMILVAGDASATVRLKLAVVNPSATKTQTMPVRYDLPKGIVPEHVIDAGKMEIAYDFEKQNHYVYQDVVLEPGEKIVLEIELEDIWLIPEDDLAFLRTHTAEVLSKLVDTRHEETGNTLTQKINSRLDAIAREQKSAGFNIREKINIFYKNTSYLDETKKNIGMLENLVIDLGGILEERVDVPPTMAIALSSDDGKISSEDIIELRIRAKNPSSERAQLTPVKYYLPQEVGPQHIVDSGGLEMAYDFKSEVFYVFRNDVELDPAETRVFTVGIFDVWRIPLVELEAIRAHTGNLAILLEGTAYQSQGESLSFKIISAIEKIIELQTRKASPTEHIAYYRDNISSFAQTKRLVGELEKLVTQTGAAPGVTITRGKGQQEVETEDYTGLKWLAKALFRGKAPDEATTWRILWMIIGFLALFSAIFFFVQLSHHKVHVIDALTGLHSRKHLIDALHEVHRTAQGRKGIYAILMLDIDNLKYVNATYGHDVGDTLLRMIASALKDNLPPEATAGRYGGDEFMAVLPETEKKDAEVITQNIQASIEKIKITHMGQEVPAHASIGIAGYPEDGTTTEAVFVTMDKAMFEAKNRRKTQST